MKTNKNDELHWNNLIDSGSRTEFCQLLEVLLWQIVQSQLQPFIKIIRKDFLNLLTYKTGKILTVKTPNSIGLKF